MKKLQSILLIVALVMQFVNTKAQESYFKISAGYSLPIGTQVLNQEYGFPNSSTASVSTSMHYRAMSCVYGTGLNLGASYIHMFSKQVGLELYGNYQTGTNHVNWMYPDVAYSLESDASSSYYSEGQSSSYSRGFFFSPMLIFQPHTGKGVQTYVKAGVVMGNVDLTSNSTENNIEASTGIASVTIMSQNSTGSSFGLRGGIGAIFSISDKITFSSELLFTSMQYHPSNSGPTKYSVNGVTPFGEITLPDPTRTIENISSATVGSVMLNLGIQVKIGRSHQ